MELSKRKEFTVWGANAVDWAALLTGIFMMLVSGSLYSYAAFGDALKEQLDLSNSVATLIPVVGNFGLCFATPAGWFCDRFGPKLSAVVGGVLSSAGFFCCYLTLEGWLPNKGWLLCLYFAVLGQGSQFTYMPAFMTYKNFGTNYVGRVVGILDCMFGLSAFFVSLLYTRSFGKGDIEHQKVGAFFLTFGIVMAVANICGLVVIRIRNAPTAAAPLDDDFQLLLEDESDKPVGDTVCDEDIGGWQLLMRLDFWLIFVVFLVVAGTGLIYMSNVGFMLKSLHMEEYTSALALVIPLSSAVCRFFMGLVTDHLDRYVSRGSLVVVCCAIMTTVQGMLYFFMRETIIPSAVLVGVAFGGMWCLVPIIVSQRFGRTHFGFNWGTMIFGSALGPLPFQALQDYVYESHSKAGSKDCYGTGCYQTTYAVACGVSLVVTGLAVLMSLRLRKGKQW